MKQFLAMGLVVAAASFIAAMPPATLPIPSSESTLSRTETLPSGTTEDDCVDKFPASKEILLGMSTALTGPSADLGWRMREGILAGIDQVNRMGGIHGRPLRLIALDDGYEPTRTTPNMRRLIEKDCVLAVVGNVGTPTAVAALPIAIHSRTPFIGAFTGAGVLRKTPPERYIINYRASYAQETAAMVDALIEEGGLSIDQIGFFVQRDAFGDAGLAGGVAALQRHGLRDDRLIPQGRYERNTLAVEGAVADLLRAKPPPRAIIMVGVYQPCAAFIRLAREHGLDALFLNVSFVGPTSLAQALGDAGDNVIITQVVPHPELDEAPVTADFRDALQASDPTARPSFEGIEGYIVMRIVTRALQLQSEALTRETLTDALDRLGEFDIGLGEPLRLTPEQRQACQRVWPTIIREGRIVPFEWRELAGLLQRESD